MTYMTDEWLEEYIKNLSWAEGTPDEQKTVVAGNLRAMYHTLMGKIETDVLTTMQSAFAADPMAMRSLTVNRVPCNEALADHPHVTVQSAPLPGGPPEVGMLGVVVGIMSAIGCRHIVSWAFKKPTEPTGSDQQLEFTGFKLIARDVHPGSGPAVPSPQ